MSPAELCYAQVAFSAAACVRPRRNPSWSTKLADVREHPLVAVVGADTLLAKELREVLDGLPVAPRVQLIAAASDGSTVLAAEEEDVVVMTPLIAESLAGVKVAFLAGSPASSRKAAKVAEQANLKGDTRLIDLSGALEERPNARLRAPMAEPLPPVGIGDAVEVIAHPGAIALTIFLSALARGGKLRRTLIHVFEPASERDQESGGTAPADRRRIEFSKIENRRLRYSGQLQPPARVRRRGNGAAGSH